MVNGVNHMTKTFKTAVIVSLLLALLINGSILVLAAAAWWVWHSWGGRAAQPQYRTLRVDRTLLGVDVLAFLAAHTGLALTS